MFRKENYLFSVADTNENNVTELLLILMSKKYIRDLILESLGIEQNCIIDIDYSHISSQKNINGKRPDMVIENRDTYIIIENKIHNKTELQESQKEQGEYKKALEKRKEKYKALVFIIPADYEHLQILKSMEKESSSLIKIIIWDSLLERLIAHDLMKTDEATRQALEFIISSLGINSVLNSFTKGELIYMYDTHLVTNVHHFLWNLKKYVMDAGAMLVKKHKNTPANLEKTILEDMEGHICCWLGNAHDKYIIYIGCSLNMERKKEDERYMYSIMIKEDLIKNKNIDGSVIFKSWRRFRIEPKVFESDNVVQQLYEQANLLIKQYVLEETIE